ncbi:bifunctional folylpolyglutamate synthase/dihydrofolate synthase [Sphingomonas sp. Leaf412]|uniref:bifunctional folylpolyglutamate synthase/dihydrofolate synthase n=1 Tax=Sphingomonas sp. Leaf412 TaxID=1736370 RepID=UPI0006F3E35A|nr:Mur ligase family protein [Sphingomonas sp. Leaf412]KQT32435.1 bifunctional folylpolyglutamate synthase/dihydrofolate synthase [Sphingomonas sp. Leaf412]
MPDHASSSDPAVQAQLDRLWALSPGADILGLDRITRLLARVGDPHLRLPPVFHVAGTNGKGSTCAFLRAALEAAGHRVHVYTSPHLVRFNERIRVAGTLIPDAALAPLLAEVLDAGGDIGASFFEVTTAAAFLAFARTPADACVIEVGLGGRLDATNVVVPVVAGIAALGIDHQAFLGDTLPGIAAEKAGIAKGGVPLATLSYPDAIAAVIARVADAAGAPLIRSRHEWRHAVDAAGGVAYRDSRGAIDLPAPRLAGRHQADNLALAVAMIRHQRAVPVPVAALAAGAVAAAWPARLQRLGDGPLTALLPTGTPVWLDGGHNASAGTAIAQALPAVRTAAGPLVIVMGMLANKDVAGFLAPFACDVAAVVAVPVPGHDHHPPEAIVAAAAGLGIAEGLIADSVDGALPLVAARHPAATVLIAGSLYLAGEVLAANGEPPR